MFKKIWGKIKGCFCLCSVVCCAIFIYCGECKPQYRDCDHCKKVIGVYPHHATRVYVRYESKSGSICERTVHQSNIFNCNDNSINPHNYLDLYGGRKTYGDLIK